MSDCQITLFFPIHATRTHEINVNGRLFRICSRCIKKENNIDWKHGWKMRKAAQKEIRKKKLELLGGELYG